MTRLNFNITALFTLTFFLQGCAGVRNSYESLLDKDADEPLIVLEVGDEREILAVGDGFPGWYGYYPTIFSTSPEVASVDCKRGRSFIPFREPGIIFGGERCYIHAHQPGTTLLAPGNKFTGSPIVRLSYTPEKGTSIIRSEEANSPADENAEVAGEMDNHLPNDVGTLILMKVVPTSDH